MAMAMRLCFETDQIISFVLENIQIDAIIHDSNDFSLLASQCFEDTIFPTKYDFHNRLHILYLYLM